MKQILEAWRQYSKGVTRLYHYSEYDSDDLVLDPEYFISGRNPFSKRDFATSGFPRTFFYTDLGNVEKQIASQKHLYYVDVPTDKIYNIEQDPESLREKSKGPYGLSLNFDELFQNIVSSGYLGAYYTIQVGSTGVVVWFEPIRVNKTEIR